MDVAEPHAGMDGEGVDALLALLGSLQNSSFFMHIRL